MNIGDKVKVIVSDYESPQLQVGNTGTIIGGRGLEGDKYQAILLKMDELVCDGDGVPYDAHPEFDGWCFYKSELEVIK